GRRRRGEKRRRGCGGRPGRRGQAQGRIGTDRSHPEGDGDEGQGGGLGRRREQVRQRRLLGVQREGTAREEDRGGGGGRQRRGRGQASERATGAHQPAGDPGGGPRHGGARQGDQ